MTKQDIQGYQEDPYQQKFFNEKGHRVLRPGGLHITEEMLAYCSLDTGATVVDVGCGAGITVEYLESVWGLDAYGYDESYIRIQEGRDRCPELKIFQGNGERLPHEDDSVDLVLCECSISDMAHSQRAIYEIYRILKPGGLLAVSDIYFRQEKEGHVLKKQLSGGCLSRGKSQREWEIFFRAVGLELLTWVDRTNCWKSYVAELLMKGASLESLYSCVLSENTCGDSITSALSKAKPGYFWTILQKTS